VAPIDARGSDKHPTYRWVQRQRAARQDEEIKRLLYVACTRARRELHLLGTATMTASGLKSGDSKSLLETGWPAFRPKFEEAVKHREAEKVVDFPLAEAEQASFFEVFDLAAGVEDRGPRLTVKRLPSDAEIQPRAKNVTVSDPIQAERAAELVRPEGSRRARVVGNAVHALLDSLSRGKEPSGLQQRARSMLRAAAFSGKSLDEAMQEVMTAVQACMKDAVGRWILEPHPGAQSEASWTGWVEDALVTLRADRVIRAGAAPLVAGSDHLWIIDYKMSAPTGEMVEEFLSRQREYYAPQLARYAQALSELEGRNIPLRLGLYYPRLPRFDWWSDGA